MVAMANCRKLTPFVTKRMAPTKSNYMKTIDVNGRKKLAEKGLDGMDYLQYWASVNTRESLKYEELDAQRAAAANNLKK